MKRLSWTLAALLLALQAGCSSCIDLQTGRQYPCNPGADAGVPECPDDFRCGLEGYCHPVGVPDSYLCNDDRDCEGGWLCSFDGVCRDATAELLRPEAQLRFTAQQINPLLPVEMPAAVAATVASGDTAYLAFVPADGGVKVVTRSLSNPFHVESMTPSPLPPSEHLGVAADMALYSLDGGHLYGLRGGSSSDALLDGSLDRLTLIPGSLGFPLLFGSARYSSVDAGQPAPPLWIGSKDAPAAIMDVVGIGQGDGPACALAATNAGLFVAERNSTGSFVQADGGTSATLSPEAWVPLSLEGFRNTCSGAIWSQPLRLYPSATLLAVEGISEGLRETSQVALYQADPSGTPRTALGGCPAPLTCGGQVPALLVVGPCPDVCGLDSDIVDVRPVWVDSEPQMEVRCRSRAAELERVLRIRGSAGAYSTCEAQPAKGASSFYFDTIRAAPVKPGRLAYRGKHGQLWLTSNSGELVPLTLDRAPEALVELTDGGVRTFDQELYARGSPGLGLLAFPRRAFAPAQAGATIAGQPTWVVFDDGVVRDVAVPEDAAPRPLAFLSADVTSFDPPYTGTLASTADGGTMLVVSSLDSVLAAPIPQPGSPPGPGPQQVELELKVVPFSRSPILSIAPIPPSTGGAWLSAYVLTEAGLFLLTADSETRWRTREVLIPDGEPIRVWMDAERGRLAYRDGAVYSLPSLVQIAAALEPEPGQPAPRLVDLAVVCGTPVALAPRDVFVLDPPGPHGGVVGRWTRLDPFGLAPSGEPLFARGRLHTGGDHLYSFTSHGAGVRMSPTNGCL